MGLRFEKRGEPILRPRQRHQYQVRQHGVHMIEFNRRQVQDRHALAPVVSRRYQALGLCVADDHRRLQELDQVRLESQPVFVLPVRSGAVGFGDLNDGKPIAPEAPREVGLGPAHAQGHFDPWVLTDELTRKIDAPYYVSVPEFHVLPVGDREHAARKYQYTVRQAFLSGPLVPFLAPWTPFITLA